MIGGSFLQRGMLSDAQMEVKEQMSNNSGTFMSEDPINNYLVRCSETSIRKIFKNVYSFA